MKIPRNSGCDFYAVNVIKMSSFVSLLYNDINDDLLQPALKPKPRAQTR